MTYLEAAYHVLAQAGAPLHYLHYAEIIHHYPHFPQPWQQGPRMWVG